MRLADAAYFVLPVLVIERFFGGLGIGRPDIHRKRQRDGGKRVAMREPVCGVRALQRIRFGDQGCCLCCQRRGGTQAKSRQNCVQCFHDKSEIDLQRARPSLVLEANPQ